MFSTNCERAVTSILPVRIRSGDKLKLGAGRTSLEFPLLAPKPLSRPKTDTDQCDAEGDQRSRIRYDESGHASPDGGRTHHGTDKNDCQNA